MQKSGYAASQLVGGGVVGGKSAGCWGEWGPCSLRSWAVRSAGLAEAAAAVVVMVALAAAAVVVVVDLLAATVDRI